MDNDLLPDPTNVADKLDSAINDLIVLMVSEGIESTASKGYDEDGNINALVVVALNDKARTIFSTLVTQDLLDVYVAKREET